MRRESSSSQNRKAGHTLTHSHTHTQDDCYTLAANAYARVMTTKVLSSRPRINAARPTTVGTVHTHVSYFSKISFNSDITCM